MNLLDRKENFYQLYNEQVARLENHSKYDIALNPKISEELRMTAMVKGVFEDQMAKTESDCATIFL